MIQKMRSESLIFGALHTALENGELMPQSRVLERELVPLCDNRTKKRQDLSKRKH